MYDVISLVVCDDHFLRCSTETIARDGEALVPRFVIDIPEKLCDLWMYLDFKLSNGEKYKTPRISVDNGKGVYDVPAYVLSQSGTLEAQVVFQNADGLVWKSNAKEFNVRHSVNAVDDIPNKEDFIATAQKLLDELSSGRATAAVVSYIDLLSSNWVGTESPYSQVVTVDGVTEWSKVDINPSIEQLDTFHKKDIAFVAENEDGVVTVYCIGQKPTDDYNMQVTITEVSANG